MSLNSFRLRSLPGPARVLALGFLAVVALGFVMAHVNLHLQHAHLDGQPGLSFSDVVAAYHGRPGSTLLTSKIDGGSMERYIPRPSDKALLLDWVGRGAAESEFGSPAEVLDRLCVRCHHPGGEMAQAAFAETRSAGASWSLVAATVVPDAGKSAASVARSSHAHLFGMGVLFALLGLVFLGTDLGARTKAVSVALPFAAMTLDIGSWWLTRWHAGFAFGIVTGGALLALAMAWLVARSAYEVLTPRSPAGSPDEAETAGG